MIGPGKFNDLATMIRETTMARGVMVIVLDSPLGSGIAAQFTREDYPMVTEMLQKVIREMGGDLKTPICDWRGMACGPGEGCQLAEGHDGPHQFKDGSFYHGR